MRPKRRNHSENRRGQSLVEATFVLLLFFAFLLGNFFCLVLQRLHRTFQRGPFQNFGTLLQRFAQFFLLFNQLSKRLFRLLTRELLRR